MKPCTPLYFKMAMEVQALSIHSDFYYEDVAVIYGSFLCLQAQRLHDLFHEPFIRPKKPKLD